jgi:glycosyltransferase involved in cell wall biosynthesis
MTAWPQVSVVISSYNYAQFLSEAIESALAQEYPNLEVLVSDDCSTDGSAAIAQAIAQRDPRVKFWVNERNLGAVPNCNRALDRCSGEYVAFLSADNFMLPGHLAAAIGYYVRHPECGLRSTGWLTIHDDSSRPWAHRDLLSWRNIAAFSARPKLEDIFCYGDQTSIETIVFPRRLLERLGTFDETLYHNDIELLARYADRGVTFAHEATPYVVIRYHPGGRGAPAKYVATGKQLSSWIELYQQYLTDTNARRLVGRRRRVMETFGVRLQALERRNPELHRAMSEEPSIKEQGRRVAAIPDKLTADRVVGPRFSAIVPTVGRVGLLLRSLDSIASQTLRSWEVIVVQNDGNDVEPVLRSLPYRDRIVYARTLTTGSAAGARNLGIRLALGESIAYLDEGDVWSEQHLARAGAALDDLNVDVVRTQARAIFYDDPEGMPSLIETNFFAPFGEPFVDGFGLYAPMSSVVHRKYCVEAIGGFDEALVLREDWEFLLRLVGVGWYRIVQLPDVSLDASYRKHLLLHALGERPQSLVPSIQYVYAKHAARGPDVEALRNGRLAQAVTALNQARTAASVSAFAGALRALAGAVQASGLSLG